MDVEKEFGNKTMKLSMVIETMAIVTTTQLKDGSSPFFQNHHKYVVPNPMNDQERY